MRAINKPKKSTPRHQRTTKAKHLHKLSKRPATYLQSSHGSIKDTAEFDSLKTRHPNMKHDDSLPSPAISPFPEDSLYVSYRQTLRNRTDRLIQVRQNNIEPLSYTHQIIAAHCVDPTTFSESATQLVIPSRLVLDGAEGVEALAYYDRAISMPLDLDPEITELKLFARTLLLENPSVPKDFHVSPDTGLRGTQLARIPTTFHANSFLLNTPKGYLHDLAFASKCYEKHISYAETSTHIKNIGFWGLEAGTADQTFGQHYALPGMLVATTSPKTLGYVAALGGVSLKVSPIEAAGIMAGQPVHTFQPSEPILINLHGALGQWISPHDIATTIIQYLGERAFMSVPLGLPLPLAIEIHDKGNQFSIDELATICTTIGSLPTVGSITVPSNINQLKYLRDHGRGAFSIFQREYGPQLLEPDVRSFTKDVVNINLSTLLPNVSIHSSSIHNTIHFTTTAMLPDVNNSSTQNQSINTISCPIDYLGTITGSNPNHRLNLAKLLHMDNIIHNPSIRTELFHTGNDTQKVYAMNPVTKKYQQVLGNRYQHLNMDKSSLELLSSTVLKNMPFSQEHKEDSQAVRVGFEDGQYQTETNFIEDQQHNNNTNTKRARIGRVGQDINKLNEVNEQQVIGQQQKPSNSNSMTYKNDPNLTEMNENDYESVQLQQSTSDINNTQSSSTTTNPNTIQPTHLRTVDNSLIPPLDSVGLTSKPSQHTPQSLHHPQKILKHNQGQMNNHFWPTTPNLTLIRGGYTEMLKAAKIMLQCISEGMKPRLKHTYLQFTSLQALNLMKQDHTLIDQNGIHFLDLCESLGIVILAPGSGNIDTIVSQVILDEVEQMNTTSSSPTTPSQSKPLHPHLHNLQHNKNQQQSSHINKVDPLTLHPTILTTDINLTSIDGGLQHYTPHLFTSSHEFVALSIFTGSIAFDPINTTLSPTKGHHEPNDHESFFVLPSTGVKPEIDANTGKLAITTQHDTQWQNTAILSPLHSYPTTVYDTNYQLPRRFDLSNESYAAKYNETTIVKHFPTFWDLEGQLGDSQYHTIIPKSSTFNQSTISDVYFNEHPHLQPKEKFNRSLANESTQTTTTLLHDYLNLHLTCPTKLGYNYRPLPKQPITSSKTTPNQQSIAIDKFISLINQTNLQLTIYPSTWWNNEDLVDLPVLCNANTPTSASDIAGLNSQLKLTPIQRVLAHNELTNWVQGKLFNTKLGFNNNNNNNNTTTTNNTNTTSNTTSTTNTTNPTPDTNPIDLPVLFTDMISRRLQSTPRHLKTLFPFHQPQLQIRYGLSGLRSTQPGSIVSQKAEFIAATTPVSTTDGQSSKSTIGIGLGQKLAQLKEILRTSQFGSYFLPLNSKLNTGDDIEEYFKNKNIFSEETNMLWSIATTRTNVATNEFISNIMPAVRSFLKIPNLDIQHESHDNNDDTNDTSINSTQSDKTASIPKRKTIQNQLEELQQQNQQPQSQIFTSIQTIVWNYFATGQKWVLIGDGSNPMKLPNYDAIHEEIQNQFRWDQRGFGYGTIDECDDAAKTLQLLGCRAIFAQKIGANMMRACRTHGIITLQFDEVNISNKITPNDTISIMTHHEQYFNIKTNEAVADEHLGEYTEDQVELRRVPLMLPHQPPTVVLHKNGNIIKNSTKKTKIPKVNIHSETLPVISHYDPYSLVWFRAGSIANAGVEYQLRRALVDQALRYNDRPDGIVQEKIV